MAIGDDATSAGYPTVPNTGDQGRVRLGAQEINRTRDFVAQNKINAAVYHFDTLGDMYAHHGAFPWQMAIVRDTSFSYQWTGNQWRLWFAAGTWTPNINGPGPFYVGSDNIRAGRWQVDGDRFLITGRIVFGGGVNLDTSGQHAAINGLPGDFSIDTVGALGHGIYRAGWGGRIHVDMWAESSDTLYLRTIKTDGAIGDSEGSFSQIDGEAQSDTFHFNLSGFRNL